MNDNVSCGDRRWFLRFGLLAGVVGAAGCGGEATQTVTTPPIEGGKGVRNRLNFVKDKVEEGPKKPKKK